MSFSILTTTRRLLSPQHELSCSWWVWRRLMTDLRVRGGGMHESGAFLLGSRHRTGAHIADFILYDDLDLRCLDSGIVRLDGRHFGKLWDICRARKITVVADVHTHPLGAGQSPSDKAHPIIAQAGHIALIVPRFAEAPVRRSDVGVYKYLGRQRWKSIRPEQRQAFFRVGL